ncbi:MAG: 2-pyrone-4,6-dicarboxylate hydrolase [Betaproteobacteria bacterium]|nr:2-pyrone-4,6-dicarboxylate hydrolase [Betaproteobacteria bacterium]
MTDNTQHQVPNSSGTHPPKLKAPANAADCHIHIYDPRFQPAVDKPQNGTVGDYRLLQKRIGVSRVVIVQPRNYKTDNSATLDAIKQLGIANARGVGVLHPTVDEAELKRLDDGGIRGIRFTLGSAKNAVVSIDMIEPLARRIAPYGWHVQLNMDPQQVTASADMLKRLPTQIVFDHMGKPPMPAGIKDESHKVIRGLIDAGRAWVKISGAYIVDDTPPAYAGATSVAQAFVRAAPERAVWGSDWPHPGHQEHPDDAALFDLLSVWAPDEKVRNRILVDNPQKLYGFG